MHIGTQLPDWLYETDCPVPLSGQMHVIAQVNPYVPVTRGCGGEKVWVGGAAGAAVTFPTLGFELMASSGPRDRHVGGQLPCDMHLVGTQLPDWL